MSEREEQFHALYRRLRIEAERKYFEARSKEYEDAYQQANMVRNVLLVAASCTGIGVQLISDESWRAALGVLGSMLAALAAAVIAYSAIMGFQQLQKLYDDAAFSMTEAELDWDEAQGKHIPQLNRVEQILRVENGQWGQLVPERVDNSTLNVDHRP